MYIIFTFKLYNINYYILKIVIKLFYSHIHGTIGYSYSNTNLVSMWRSSTYVVYIKV